MGIGERSGEEIRGVVLFQGCLWGFLRVVRLVLDVTSHFGDEFVLELLEFVFLFVFVFVLFVFVFGCNWGVGFVKRNAKRFQR